MIVYRLHGRQYDSFDTEGAFLHAGRWHPAGIRVIYASAHVSLAVLENLVHAGGQKLPPRSLTPVEIPDDLSLETADWEELPFSRQRGERWVGERRTAVLRVPSIAVNKLEWNVVLNPAHPDFSRITRQPTKDFLFDVRLPGSA